jgi:hypothetical protein
LSRRPALLIFLLTLVLRVAIAAQFPGNFDSQSFLLVGDAVLAGQNVYGATDRYNYSPLWSYIVAALWRIALPNGSLFVLLVGLFAISVDVLTAVLLLRLARDRLGFSPARARHAALLFFANPVSVAVSCGHGQFDGLAILFLVAAISAAMSPHEREGKKEVVLWLSLSLLVKHVTAFHPFLFLRSRRRRGLSLASLTIPYAVFLLSFVPFLSGKNGIAENVFLYPTRLLGPKRLRPGGLRSLLEFSRFSDQIFLAIFFVAVAAVLCWSRRLELPRASMILFLALLIFLPGFSPQYLVWPIALGSLYASPALALFSTIGALFHFGESSVIPWPFTVTAHATWVAALLWLVAQCPLVRSAGRPSEEVV